MGVAIRLLLYGWTFVINGAGLILPGIWIALRIAAHRSQSQEHAA